MTAGVPQGSVLGPLLFITYANDINNILTDIRKIIFADDTSLLCSSKDPQILINVLKNSLEKVIDWCHFNKLALNCDKTKLMVFTNRKINISPIHGKSLEI